MTGPEVIEYAITVLAETNSKSRDALLNKVRLSQIAELKSALVGVTSETNLESWEASNKYKRHLAIAILDNLKPGWNRKS